MPTFMTFGVVRVVADDVALDTVVVGVNSGHNLSLHDLDARGAPRGGHGALWMGTCSNSGNGPEDLEEHPTTRGPRRVEGVLCLGQSLYLEEVVSPVPGTCTGSHCGGRRGKA